MVGTSARVEIAGRDLARMVAAWSSLWRRWCAVPFDQDGVAVLDGERRQGLTLEEGRHLAPGTRYRMVVVSDDKAQEYGLEVVRAEDDLVEYLVDGTDTTLTVRLHDPEAPGELHFDLRVVVPEVPLLGKEFAVTGSVDPSVLRTGGRVAVGELRLKRLRVRVRVDVAARGTNGEVTVRLSGRPLGVLTPALVAWPFLRGKATRGLAEALGEAARELRSTDDLADQAWAGFVADIAR